MDNILSLTVLDIKVEVFFNSSTENALTMPSMLSFTHTNAAYHIAGFMSVLYSCVP